MYVTVSFYTSPRPSIRRIVGAWCFQRAHHVSLSFGQNFGEVGGISVLIGPGVPSREVSTKLMEKKLGFTLVSAYQLPIHWLRNSQHVHSYMLNQILNKKYVSLFPLIVSGFFKKPRFYLDTYRKYGGDTRTLIQVPKKHTCVTLACEYLKAMTFGYSYDKDYYATKNYPTIFDYVKYPSDLEHLLEPMNWYSFVCESRLTPLPIKIYDITQGGKIV